MRAAVPRETRGEAPEARTPPIERAPLLTVTVSLPGLACSPNARVHWAPRARAVKAARRNAWYWFLRAKGKDWKPVPLALRVHYHCPRACDGYRPRDVQNAIAALKPAVDGMVDAGIVPDDSHKWIKSWELRITRSRIPDLAPGVTFSLIPMI